MQVTIRLMTDSDAPLITAMNLGTDADFLYQWAGASYQYPLSIGQVIAKIHDPNCKPFLILYDGKPAGTLSIDHVDETLRECAICRFLVDRHYRGLGIGAQSLRQAVRYVFDTLGMETVWLWVFDFNKGAVRCYQKAGFLEKGWVLRDNGWKALRMECTRESFCE